MKSSIFFFLLTLLVSFACAEQFNKLFPIEIKSCQESNLKDLTCPRKSLHDPTAKSEGVPSVLVRVVVKSPKLKIKGHVCTGVYHVTSCQRNMLWVDSISHWAEFRDLDEDECKLNSISPDDTEYPEPNCEWSSYKEVRIPILSIKEHTFIVNTQTGSLEDNIIRGSCLDGRCETDGKHHKVIVDLPKLEFDKMTIATVAYIYKEGEDIIWMVSDLIGKINIKDFKPTTFLGKHIYSTKENFLIECKECSKYIDNSQEESILKISTPDFLDSHLIAEESKIWERLCELSLPVINITKSITKSQLELFRPRMPGTFNLIAVDPNGENEEDDLYICQAKWDYRTDLESHVEEQMNKALSSNLYHTNIGSMIKGKLSKETNLDIGMNLVLYDGHKVDIKLTNYQVYHEKTFSKSKKIIRTKIESASINTGLLRLINYPVSVITSKIAWVLGSMFSVLIFIWFAKTLLFTPKYQKVNKDQFKCHI